MKAPRISEHAEQATVIQWWESFSRTRGIDSRLLLAIPNAQKFLSKARNLHAAYATLKREGHRDGAPDLLLAWPLWREEKGAQGQTFMATLFPGMFVEMKRKGERVAPGSEQATMIGLLRHAGYNVVVSAGADEAIKAIREYVDRGQPCRD